jgi:membrane-associated phospholipid phosphatase
MIPTEHQRIDGAEADAGSAPAGVGTVNASPPLALQASMIGRGIRSLLIAPDDDRAPEPRFRAIVFPLVFVPWLVLYEWVVYRGPAPSAFTTYLPGELHWPIWQWMEILYVSAYLLVPLAPLVASTNRVLRRFVVAGIMATLIVMLLFLLLPAIAPPRPFEPSGLLGRMMLTDRLLDRNNGTAAFPSFHVVWAFLGAAVLVARVRDRQKKRADNSPGVCIVPAIGRGLCWAWATAVAASCIFTGMHSLCDVLAGFIVFMITWHCARGIERAPVSGLTDSSAVGLTHGGK